MQDFKILDEIKTLIYISDIDTHDLLLLNQAARAKLGITKEKSCYGKCYAVIQGNTAPCSFCNNADLCRQTDMSWAHQYNDGTTYFIQDHYFERDGRRLRMECAADISEREEDARQMRINLETERLLVDCVQKLISSQHFEDSVSHVLQTILRYYKGARSYIFQFNWEKEVGCNTYEECAEGITPEIDSLQAVPLSVMHVWVNNFKKRGYIHIEDMDALKNVPARREEYDALAAQGIRRLLAVPFYYNDTMQGFIGVDDPEVHTGDISFLQNLTYFISAEIEKHELNRNLLELSYYDFLTRFQNRNAYNKFLAQARSLENVGVAFIDVNGLKYINDTLGHACGDKAILMTANIIRCFFDESQTYRISGDEYVILCPDCAQDWFLRQIEDIREEFRRQADEIAAAGYVWEAHPKDLNNMIYRAEQIMYINKQRFYNSAPGKKSKHRSPVLDFLVEKMNAEQFLVFLQPKANLQTGRVFGAEALIRRREPDGRIVSPFEFIPLFEHEKVIARIDYFVLDTVCAQLAGWQRAGAQKMVISVNISRITLAENDFTDKVLSLCDAHGVEHSQIEFEITESSETLDKNRLVAIVSTLKAAGFGVSLDDMGNEYSSLTMLTIPGIDVVKIDKSFVQRMEGALPEQILIEHVIQLCHALGQTCVAEGVETESQRALLKAMGCDCIQGYLLDKPLPTEQFEKKYLAILT